jgi:hypothetical protein
MNHLYKNGLRLSSSSGLPLFNKVKKGESALYLKGGGCSGKPEQPPQPIVNCQLLNAPEFEAVAQRQFFCTNTVAEGIIYAAIGAVQLPADAEFV